MKGRKNLLGPKKEGKLQTRPNMEFSLFLVGVGAENVGLRVVSE
jgi:hypothetical protein